MRALGGAFGFIAVLFAFEIGGDWFYKGEFLFDPIWVVLMGFSTAAYLTLRTLEKHTRYLHVEGR